MLVFEFVLVILFSSVLLSALAWQIKVPYPALLALGGVVLAVIPGAPRIVLRSEERRVGDWSSDVCSSDLSRAPCSRLAAPLPPRTGRDVTRNARLRICARHPVQLGAAVGAGLADQGAVSGAAGARRRRARRHPGCPAYRPQIGRASCRGLEFRRVLFRSEPRAVFPACGSVASPDRT